MYKRFVPTKNVHAAQSAGKTLRIVRASQTGCWPVGSIAARSTRLAFLKARSGGHGRRVVICPLASTLAAAPAPSDSSPALAKQPVVDLDKVCGKGRIGLIKMVLVQQHVQPLFLDCVSCLANIPVVFVPYPGQQTPFNS